MTPEQLQATIAQAVQAAMASQPAAPSKVKAAQPLIIQISQDGMVLGTFTTNAEERTFSSGSRGYYAGGKLGLPGGKQLQCGLNFTIIGSKPQG